MEQVHDIGVFLNESECLQLISLTRALATCTEPRAFLAALKASQGLLFFDHAIGGLALVGKDGTILKRSTINLNYPKGFVDTYFQEDLEKENTYLAEVKGKGGPCFWGEAAQKNPPGARLRGLMGDFGLQNGCSHGLFVPSGGLGSYFSFQAAWLKGFDPRCSALLSYLTPFLHQAICRVFRDEGSTGDGRILSPREVETLRWVRAGKNTWETSQILGVSQNTVKFHLKNAMAKLGAANRSHAVALAMGQGLLGE